MRLDRKVAALRALGPDVAVVPECACPELLLRRAPDLGASSFAWQGDRPHKGLAVLAFPPWTADAAPLAHATGPSALPVLVRGPAPFRLVAVWAPGARELGRALDVLDGFVRGPRVVLAGDFNATLVRRGRAGPRPTRLARRLGGLGFASAYHLVHGVEHGREDHATFFRRGRHRRPGRVHHSDLVFVGAGGGNRVRAVEVATGPEWLLASDHAPVLVELG